MIVIMIQIQIDLLSSATQQINYSKKNKLKSKKKLWLRQYHKKMMDFVKRKREINVPSTTYTTMSCHFKFIARSSLTSLNTKDQNFLLLFLQKDETKRSNTFCSRKRSGLLKIQDAQGLKSRNSQHQKPQSCLLSILKDFKKEKK